LKVNGAFCWLLLYGYITMRGQQNIKYIKISQNLAERLKTMPENFKL